MYDGFSVKTHRTVDYKQWLFGWAGSSLLCRLLSSYGEQGLLSGCEVWASHCGGFSHHRAQALGHGLQEVWHLGPVGSVVVVPGFWNTGLAVVAHGLSCSRACGIFLDQGSKSCLQHWQANSLPLSYQGSPACLVAQSCPNFCDSTDHSPPGSSIHGILQARMPEWVAISICRGSSQPRDWTCVSCVSFALQVDSLPAESPGKP